MTGELERALLSTTRGPEIPEASDVYGWLVGSWDLEVRWYAGVDLTGQGVRGELHAARVLEGRGVQDTWIMPPRGQRAEVGLHNMYGTTLRTWDPALAAWRIAWSNPARNHYEHQIGRWSGEGASKIIVQLGARGNGVATRWRFTEITPRSFHWIGDALAPDGATWQLEGEFLATRIS